MKSFKDALLRQSVPIAAVHMCRHRWQLEGSLRWSFQRGDILLRVESPKAWAVGESIRATALFSCSFSAPNDQTVHTTFNIALLKSPSSP
jgi:hypothetical protein